MMFDCLFCSIAKREIPSEIIHETDSVIAFRDVAPQAPHHILIIPKEHIPTVNDLRQSDSDLVAELLLVAKDLATQLGVSDSGYRIVLNCNADAGQAVFHVHLHLLAGRRFSWPPG